MSLEEKLAVLEELMELEEGELKAGSELNDIEEWDSITKLALMAEAKKRWNKNLSADEINSFKTVDDICNYLG